MKNGSKAFKHTENIAFVSVFVSIKRKSHDSRA